MLLILTILFLQYGIVVYWAVYIAGFHQDDAPIYLQLSPVFDAIGELGLAFGMLLMAMERIRQELEDKNQQLADATRQLAHAARTDVLTGLLNRRGYEELAADKATQDYSGSVVMIDVNNLKPLNDTYGHAAGDAALQLVARALRVYFRVTDPLFRTGGDEFLVILPGGNEQDVISRMLRIDDALTGQRLPGVDHALDLGIAWGVAEFRTGSELPIAVDKADRAMYVQKQGSKSRSAEI
jgi:diguanylate cyclase (GGDEF)-like protein